MNICLLAMVRTKITNVPTDAMQAACVDVTMETPQPQEVAVDATQEVQRQVQLLELEQSELECAFLDESFFHKKGAVLQFVNNNCPGATSLIGGLRLGLEDIRKVPAYLEKNSDRIKHFAIKCLDRHIKTNQCCVGAGEKLTYDDYGISFSLATVSARAALLNHSKRQEGQLFYCLFPGLLEPVFLGINPDMSNDFAHVINVFIHLMPGSQRRNVFFLSCPLTMSVLQPLPPPHQSTYLVRGTKGVAPLVKEGTSHPSRMLQLPLLTAGWPC